MQTNFLGYNLRLRTQDSTLETDSLANWVASDKKEQNLFHLHKHKP